MVKTRKNLLLQNQESFKADSYYIASVDSRSTKFGQMMTQISHGAICQKGFANLFKWFRFWTRWPPCPYMVKILKNLLIQNQESFEAESWYIIEDSSSTKYVQMMIVVWPLTFFTARSNLHLYRFVWGKKLKNLFFNMLSLMAETYIVWLKL